MDRSKLYGMYICYIPLKLSKCTAHTFNFTSQYLADVKLTLKLENI